MNRPIPPTDVAKHDPASRAWLNTLEIPAVVLVEGTHHLPYSPSYVSARGERAVGPRSTVRFASSALLGTEILINASVRRAYHYTTTHLATLHIPCAAVLVKPLVDEAWHEMTLRVDPRRCPVAVGHPEIVVPCETGTAQDGAIAAAATRPLPQTPAVTICIQVPPSCPHLSRIHTLLFASPPDQSRLEKLAAQFLGTQGAKEKRVKEIDRNAIDALIPEREPQPPVTFFHTADARSLSLGYAAWRDYRHEFDIRNRIKDAALTAVAIDVPGRYVDGKPTAYLLAVRPPFQAELMPPVGSAVSIAVCRPFKVPPEPRDLAKTVAPYLDRVYRAHEHDEGGPDEALREALARVIAPGHRRRLDDLCSSLMLRLGWDELDVESCDVESCSCDTGLACAEAWVRQNKTYLQPLPDDKEEPPTLAPAWKQSPLWEGRRILCPPDLQHLGSVLFHATIPQAAWAQENGVTAPLEYDMPVVQVGRGRGRGRRDADVDADKDKSFRIVIEVQASEPTAHTRLTGLREFAQVEALAELSQWHLNFVASTTRDFFAIFPVAASLRDGACSYATLREDFARLDRDQRAAFDALAACPEGVWILAGCPGSGKTSLLMLALAAAQAAPADVSPRESGEPEATRRDDRQGSASPSAATREEAQPPAETPARSSKAIPRVFIAVSQNAQGDDIAASYHAGALRHGLGVQVTRLGTYTREFAELDRQYRPASSASRPEIDEIDALDLLEEDAALAALARLRVDDERDGADADADADAARMQGSNLTLAARAIRLLQTGAGFEEFRRLLRKKNGEAEADREDRDDDESEESEEDEAEYERRAWQAALRQAMAQALGATHVLVGTPVVARQLANQFDGAFGPAIVVVEEAGRMTEPDVLAVWAAFPRARFRFLSGDSRQMPPHVFSFDQRRRPPHGLSFDRRPKQGLDGGCTNIFGPQLAQSLLARAEKAGAPVQHLRVNWRAFGGLEEYASGIAYREQMTAGHGPDACPPGLAAVRAFIKQKQPAADGTMLFIDVEGADEQKQGTSYINRAHADRIAALVDDLVAAHLPSAVAAAAADSTAQARILVMAPYAAQTLNLLRTLSRRLTPACRRLVDVRTVDGAMGHEADIAILDLTRTRALGFTDDVAMLNVGTTRARLAQFVVGNAALIIDRDDGGKLGQLYEDCRSRGAVVREWASA